jgi:hypothetical protein
VPEWRALGFLSVLLAYMLGPNPKVGGVQGGDLLLLVYVATYLATSRLRSRGEFLVFFLWPTVVVAFTLVGKILSGLPTGPDERNNIVKVASLSVLGLLGASLGVAQAQHDSQRLLNWSVRLAGIGIVFTCVLGLIQFLRPGVYQALVHGLYEKQLIINISNVEQAELTGRISSIFTWANAFGMFILLGLIVVVLNARRVPWWLLTTASVTGVICMVLTNSRVSLVLLGIAALYVAVLQRRWSLFFAGGLTGLALIVLLPAGSWLDPRNSERLQELVDFARYGRAPLNVQVRFAVLAYLPNMLVHSDYLYFGFPEAIYRNTVALSADNQYLTFFLRYGVVGGFLSLWQWFATLWPALLLRRDLGAGKAERRLLHTLLLLNLVMAIGALSQDTLFLERWREFYFAFTGVALGSWSVVQVRSKTSSSSATVAS